MAANPNANIDLRDDFLVGLTALARNHIHTASDLGLSHLVRQAIQDTGYRVRNGTNGAVAQRAIAQGAWMTFLNYHNIHWGSHGNPLRVGNERAAVIYFSRFIEPVLTEMNTLRQAQQQHFAVSTGQYAFAVRQQPRIRITGYCGYAIMCNAARCCIVEHKRYEEDDAHFNRGIDQAIVYAAAIGHQHGQQRTPAIVTDLRRWRFLSVDRNGLWQSREYRIRYTNNGRPDRPSLESIIQRMASFLHTEWP